ncbi:MAG: FdtA/QdtA family cupin domain-containing protein [Alphaproteobacteria bacterium]|nr:FdtA/QdtA family cupin domain-containing protein [Alphaproteobacteria bacterium]
MAVPTAYPPLGSSPLSSLEDVRVLSFPLREAAGRRLVAIEGPGPDYPLPIARVFTVSAMEAGIVGGRHAHRRCSQFLVAVHGRVEVTALADPERPDAVRRVLLDSPNLGVLLPPGIWGEQHYLDPDAVLMVLCDRPYEAADYIRDFEEFRAYRSSASMVA